MWTNEPYRNGLLNNCVSKTKSKIKDSLDEILSSLGLTGIFLLGVV